MLTPPVGKSVLAAKPTAANDPLVGIIYNSLVELNETVDELGWMVQGTVVSLSSMVNVIAVETDAFRVPMLSPPPKYAYPIFPSQSPPNC